METIAWIEGLASSKGVTVEALVAHAFGVDNCHPVYDSLSNESKKGLRTLEVEGAENLVFPEGA